jgi:hypothetical protein
MYRIRSAADLVMDADRLSFLTRRPRPAFGVRKIVVPPRGERTYRPAEWEGALVLVESGVIELETPGGFCGRFVRGDVLWLAGLRLKSLRNRGRLPAVLSATSRRGPGTASAFSPAADRLRGTKVERNA